MIQWRIDRFGVGEAEFVRFSMDVAPLVKMEHAIRISDVETREGLDDAVISEFESTVEFLYAFGIIFGFSHHEEVVDVYRDEDPSVDRVERALICFACIKPEFQD